MLGSMCIASWSLGGSAALSNEREFEIEIPDYELRAVKTFAELARVIDRRLG